MHHNMRGVLPFQLFQIPMVGADAFWLWCVIFPPGILATDITSYYEVGNTDEELDNRWMQVTAFTPTRRFFITTTSAARCLRNPTNGTAPCIIPAQPPQRATSYACTRYVPLLVYLIPLMRDSPRSTCSLQMRLCMAHHPCTLFLNICGRGSPCHRTGPRSVGTHRCCHAPSLAAGHTLSGPGWSNISRTSSGRSRWGICTTGQHALSIVKGVNLVPFS